jgi:radical SAM superfamily enzyme YgiQ (UPF0313 family)
MSAAIILSTLNARYAHSSFGLRYLYANMGELQNQTQIIEYTISRDINEVAEELVKLSPRVLGLGVYIWNTEKTLQLIKIIKEKNPNIILIVGGPEVSYETESNPILNYVDYVICNEADFLFAQTCEKIISGLRPEQKIIKGALPDIDSLKLPYDFYSDEDIKNRKIYVEASRGCPYKCEYCLSSLDLKVRNFKLELFLAEMQKLLDRGVRQFKFVDRTFNLNLTFSSAILKFFLDRVQLGLFIHFEMVPDRLPEELRSLIAQFPPGALQFEIGIQTWNPKVAANVSRRQDYKKIVENFKFLRQDTGVHTHADLIVGLPGESKESFAEGFNHLFECDADEIQVGILKRLKGTPIVRHDKEFQVQWQTEAPFQIKSNIHLTEQDIRDFEIFAKFFDMVCNSGNFVELSQYVKTQTDISKFDFYWNLSQQLYSQIGRTHSIHKKQFEQELRNALLIMKFSSEQVEEWLGKKIQGRSLDQKNEKNIPSLSYSKELISNLPERQKKHLNKNSTRLELRTSK